MAHKHGQEELPHICGQGQKLGGPHARGARPRGATPCPRPGAVAKRSKPTTKKQRLRGHRRA